MNTGCSKGVSDWDEIAVLEDRDCVVTDGESGELVTRGP